MGIKRFSGNQDSGCHFDKKMIKKMKKKPFPITIMIVALISMLVINIIALHVSSLVIMLAGAAAGLIFYAIHNRSRKDPAVK